MVRTAVAKEMPIESGIGGNRRRMLTGENVMFVADEIGS